VSQTVHVLPVNDLVEHDSEGTDCVCGPRVARVETDDGDGWIVIHHSLDGRERDE
jgi:hypothetical protein